MIVTLTTDFGRNDWFVGVMKGVILGINPDARIVDITHDLDPFDILSGAFAIDVASRYFAKSTVHVVVVDPGVGGPRRALLASTEHGRFVAPDNGLLTPVLARSRNKRVIELTDPRFFRQPVSHTFHGRDVLAPVAAWITRGVRPSKFGNEITDWKTIQWPEPEITAESAKGVILRIDRFGNLISNIPASFFVHATKKGEVQAVVGAWLVTRMVDTYAEGSPELLSALIGSHGFVEFFLKEANAAEHLGIARQTAVKIELLKKK